MKLYLARCDEPSFISFQFRTVNSLITRQIGSCSAINVQGLGICWVVAAAPGDGFPIPQSGQKNGLPCGSPFQTYFSCYQRNVAGTNLASHNVTEPVQVAGLVVESGVRRNRHSPGVAPVFCAWPSMLAPLIAIEARYCVC